MSKQKPIRKPTQRVKIPARGWFLFAFLFASGVFFGCVSSFYHAKEMYFESLQRLMVSCVLLMMALMLLHSLILWKRLDLLQSMLEELTDKADNSIHGQPEEGAND